MSSKAKKKRLLIIGAKSRIDKYSPHVSLNYVRELPPHTFSERSESQELKQPIHCRACGEQFFTAFFTTDETCSDSCAQELSWRKQLALQKIPYEPRPEGQPDCPRQITVAELQKCHAIDEALVGIERTGLIPLERYAVPDFFVKAEWEWPVVTFWYGEGIDDTRRFYGKSDSVKALEVLSGSINPASRRVTRALLGPEPETAT